MGVNPTLCFIFVAHMHTHLKCKAFQILNIKCFQLKKKLGLLGAICQILWESAGHIVEFWQLSLKVSVTAKRILCWVLYPASCWSHHILQPAKPQLNQNQHKLRKISPDLDIWVTHSNQKTIISCKAMWWHI